MILIAGWYILVLCAASVMDIKTRKIPVELPIFYAVFKQDITEWHCIKGHFIVLNV